MGKTKGENFARRTEKKGIERLGAQVSGVMKKRARSAKNGTQKGSLQSLHLGGKNGKGANVMKGQRES